MKKAINWIRKNRKKILLTDALLILSACLFVLCMAPPAKVEGLQVVDSTYSTAHIAWDKSDHATSYKVYRGSEKVFYKEVTEPKCTLTDITPDTKLTVNVTAVNEVGESPMSQIETRTEPETSGS